MYIDDLYPLYNSRERRYCSTALPPNLSTSRLFPQSLCPEPLSTLSTRFPCYLLTPLALHSLLSGRNRLPRITLPYTAPKCDDRNLLPQSHCPHAHKPPPTNHKRSAGELRAYPPKNTLSAHHHAAHQLEQPLPTHSLTCISVPIPNSIENTPLVFKAHSNLHQPPLA